MKFTNISGLPKALANALMQDSYDLKGIPDRIMSVTTIISPPKIKTLQLRHWDEVEEDVSERQWTLFGSAVHSVLEHANDKSEMLTEERWYMNTRTWQVVTTLGVTDWDANDIILSGKFDVYDYETYELFDFKFISAWSWILEKKPKPEWEAQLNINAMALKSLGFPVKSLSIIAIFRDWAKRMAFDNPDMKSMMAIPVRIWREEELRDFILNRVIQHKLARNSSDDIIPECTQEERWAKPDVWAIMKEGRKSSVKNHDTREGAEAHLRTLGTGHKIEHRKGGDIRCADYCNVNRWCHYFKGLEE